MLAWPVVSMAKPLSDLLMPGGFVILVGLIENHESMVGNAYRAPEPELGAPLPPLIVESFGGKAGR